jgi:hypothetical protein
LSCLCMSGGMTTVTRFNRWPLVWGTSISQNVCLSR